MLLLVVVCVARSDKGWVVTRPSVLPSVKDVHIDFDAARGEALFVLLVRDGARNRYPVTK